MPLDSGMGGTLLFRIIRILLGVECPSFAIKDANLEKVRCL